MNGQMNMNGRFLLIGAAVGLLAGCGSVDTNSVDTIQSQRVANGTWILAWDDCAPGWECGEVCNWVDAGVITHTGDMTATGCGEWRERMGRSDIILYAPPYENSIELVIGGSLVATGLYTKWQPEPEGEDDRVYFTDSRDGYWSVYAGSANDVLNGYVDAAETAAVFTIAQSEVVWFSFDGVHEVTVLDSAVSTDGNVFGVVIQVYDGVQTARVEIWGTLAADGTFGYTTSGEFTITAGGQIEGGAVRGRK